MNVREYEAFLAANPVVRFVAEKYGDRRPPERFATSDPYYRFLRVIGLLDEHGIAPDRDDSWLDLGCHHGQFLAIVAERYACRCVGMDDWDLKSAMPFVAFEYHPADLATTEWSDYVAPRSIKFVSALEVLEHMIDTDRFLETVNRVCPPGGYLVLSTPNINSLRNRVTVALGRYPAYLEYRNIIHHVRIFNAAALGELLSAHGFTVVAMSAVSFLPERMLRYRFARWLSEALAGAFPRLCGNLIVIAERNR